MKQLHQIALDSESRFAKHAALSKDAVRVKNEKVGFWLPYKEDLERIIHSKALRRYSDKTQVVYLVANDHITHRGYHVQCVSSFARGMAALLGLNVDLVEAISLGHDVGHPPFGHEGEGYLSEICQEAGLGAFSHARQSCRLFSEIEPLNLTLATLDGFLCHDGGMRKARQVVNFTKTWDDHCSEMKKRQQVPECDLVPKTLEATLVKMADSVSYIAKDLEDACNLGIIKQNEIPKTLLGTTNREILECAALDLVKMSLDTDTISFSEEVFEALKILRRFNFDRIYTYRPLKVESEKIKRAYGLLFKQIVYDFEQKGKKSVLWRQFLHSKQKKYVQKYATGQLVVDFIAGMTDRYFVSLLDELLIPQTIRISDDLSCN